MLGGGRLGRVCGFRCYWLLEYACGSDFRLKWHLSSLDSSSCKARSHDVGWSGLKAGPGLDRETLSLYQIASQMSCLVIEERQM